jgi:hypothetical protein
MYRYLIHCSSQRFVVLIPRHSFSSSEAATAELLSLNRNRVLLTI